MRLLHKLALAIVLMSMLAMLFPIPVAQADEIVTFPDPNLERVIRLAIGKPTGDIYQSDLDMLTTLYAPNEGITDLTGLEHCIGWHALGLGENQISDITPLAGLTNLQGLDLHNNQIGDITPVAGLTELRQLNLDGNLISDITPVAGLTNLTWLHLNGNQVSDITPVSDLTNLEGLYLDGNQVSDITPVIGLTLLLQLSLDSNHISDLTPVVGLPILRILHLSYNQISDITPLTGLDLNEVYLFGNQISDITPLAGQTHLYTLGLNNNHISDITPVTGLTQLNYLYLDDNQISDLSPLAGMINLMGLALARNKIGDITPLSGLTYLEFLGLSNNQVSDISALAGTTRMRTLDLSHNNISDITPVEGMTYQLSRLRLEGNQISDISPLSGEAMRFVDSLNLSHNQIIDLEPLANNLWFGGPRELDLRNNPLNSDSINIYIPELQGRGVTVFYDVPPNTPEGSNVTVNLSGSVVTFSSVTAEGYTSLTTQQANPGGEIPSGFQVSGLFVDISTTATYTSPVIVGLSYNLGEPNPQNLRLFHWEGGHWVDVTTWVDTVNHIVYGEVNSLSWFFIGGQWVWVDDASGVPVFPSVYVGIGAALLAGMAAFYIRRRLIRAKSE